MHLARGLERKFAFRKLRGSQVVKNVSKSYAAYDQVAAPSMGTTMPAGKPDNENDALHQHAGVSAVGRAKSVEINKGSKAKVAIDKQCGKDFDNMTQPNSGGESKN